MPLTCPRRIVRRAVMALAVVVLLLGGYVASWGGTFWFAGRFGMRWSNSMALVIKADQTVFAPLRLYAESDIPGGKAMHNFATWCFRLGAGASRVAGDWTPPGE